MNQVLLILLLVSVLGSRGKSVSNTLYDSKSFADLTPQNVTLHRSSRFNVSNNRSIGESSTETSTASQLPGEQDPLESSETIVYNRFAKASDNEGSSSKEEEEEEDPEGPPDHAIPYSEHEVSRDVATKPKYTAPGEWAKPPPNKDVPLDFVPTKVLAQVRKTHTLRRLPRRKAIENPESEEERQNAARLREVVKNSKVNTVYTEEGYEDSAYDHAGHIRDADYHEGYARKLHEHLGLREKSGDGNGDDRDDTGEGSANDRKYTKIPLEEFKDFEDDNYETSTEHGGNDIRGDGDWKGAVSAKLVAEEGIEKLQEDVEREAEEMEKGIEISRLERVETTTDRETSAESKKRDYYDKKNRGNQRRRNGRRQKRPPSLKKSSRENSGESQTLQEMENSTAVSTGTEKILGRHRVETTTLGGQLLGFPKVPSGTYKYGTEENSSPDVNLIELARDEESPTTISYGQILWDYFKAQSEQNQGASTEIPLIVEPTTAIPNLLQTLSFIGSVNNVLPHSEQALLEQTATSFPITESAILNPQQVWPHNFDQTLSNSEFSNNNRGSIAQNIGPNVVQNNQIISVDKPWQPLINPNEPLAPKGISFSELYNDNIFISDGPAIPLLDSQKSLDSHEEPSSNFDSSLFNPTLNSLANRKPRYKITMRHKPKKPEKQSDPELYNQETPDASDSVKEPLIKSTPPEKQSPPLMSENYMKVLSHLQNEKNIQNPHQLAGLQQNNLLLWNNRNVLEDMTRMRPPLAQKAPNYYQNFVPQIPLESEGTQFGQSSIALAQRPQQVYANQRAPQIFPAASHMMQRFPSAPVGRKKSPLPAFHLTQAAALLRDDLIKSKEPMDYVNRGGNRSKQPRNVLRPHRQAASLDGARGIRAKRRERRFVRGLDDDESGGVVKGRSIANNGTSNRGEIERAVKNLPMERNCSQKVTQGLEVGLVPDTSSRAKQFMEKKSRSCANERGKGSRAVERESSGAIGDEGKNRDIDIGDRRALEYDGAKRGGANVTDCVEIKESSSGRGNGKIEQQDSEAKHQGKGEEKDGEVDWKLKWQKIEEGMKEDGGQEYFEAKLWGEKGGKSEEDNSEGKFQEERQEEGEQVDLRGREEESKRKEVIREKAKYEELIDGTLKEDRDVYVVRKKRSIDDENSKMKNASEKHGDLVDEGSEVIHGADLIKMKSNFSGEGVPMDSKMKDELKDRAKLLHEESELSEDADSAKGKRNLGEEGSEATNKLRKHEKLLNGAPKVTEDIIEKEINDRFNNNNEKEGEGNEDVEDGEKKVEVEVPEFDYLEEIEEEEQADDSVTTEATVDLRKYPFYNSEKLPSPSALKYATDPKRLPRKTFGAMQFYDSRDAYKHCDEVEPALEVLPKEEEPIADRGPKENLPRLRGLGDKLDCFKAKYFDENPFDNPLFLEKEIEDPVVPAEIDSKQFASRIMMFPKEDDDYVIQKSSRRPESYRAESRPSRKRTSPVVYQKRKEIRYKSYPVTRSRTQKRPQSYRGAQSSRIKYTKASRRPSEKREKRPLSAASEISSLYTPYQSQVYEDVMGTIKNLANSYQVHEVTTLPASEEVTMIDEVNGDTGDGTKDVKTNSSRSSTSYGKKEKGSVAIDFMENPGKVDANVNRLRPPNYGNRVRGSYNRNRIPQRTGTRVQRMPKPVVGIRTVKRRRRVRVYKRDLSGDLNSSGKGKLLVASFELNSGERKENETETFLNSEESNYPRARYENSTTKPETTTVNYESSFEDKNSEQQLAQKLSVQKNFAGSSTTSRAIEAKRKSKAPKSVTENISGGNGDQKKEKSQRVVYTIKDRIRYSKPKGEVRKVGKFVKDPKVEEDSRRREPKYNYIRRKNPANSVTTSTASSVPSSTNKTPLTNFPETPSTTVENIFELDNREAGKENGREQYLIDETKNANLSVPDSIHSEFDRSKQDLTETSANGQTANKTSKGYEVYENVNEGVTTTTQMPQSATPAEFFNLKSFLETDLPGYSKLSADDFKNSFFLNNNNYSGDYNTMEATIANRTGNEEKETEDTSKIPSSSYFSNEESSEKLETNAKVQSSAKSSEESSVPSKESESVEDRTFFSYTTRPSSPAENYEDPKFSDLGPRVNKPAFLHPPFTFSGYRKSRLKGSSEDSDEADEDGKEEYVFPWYRDKEDRRKRKRHRGKSTSEYEYPWERRERLAREEKKRKEEKRKRLAKSFNDDEEDEAFATTNWKAIYPRGRYRFWTRRSGDVPEDSSSDNVDSSSESRPVMRYSSRYNSKKTRLPTKEQSARSRSVEEISRSIKMALEGDSKEKESSEEKESDSSEEKERKPNSYRSRGISRGMIVPEDVTLSPRKTGKREKANIKSSIDSTETSVESKNSSEVGKSTLANSESQVTVVKASLGEIGNSTRSNANELKKQSDEKRRDKKRRRPLKNSVSVETTTKAASESGKARRRQKLASTTAPTILSTSSATVSTSTVTRRRNPKSPKDPKRSNIFKIPSKPINESSGETETSTSKIRAEPRSRGRKKSRTNEIASEPTKNSEARRDELSRKDSREEEHSEKVNDREKNVETLEEKISNDELEKKKDEASESKQTFPSVKSDERFDFKDDRIDTLSDFDKSDSTSVDDDYEFGSITKTEVNYSPQNGAVQLSEQGSREIVSSVSWTSENYNF